METKKLLIRLVEQSLEQIDVLLPEANIRDLLSIAKQSLEMYSKVSEIEAIDHSDCKEKTTQIILELEKEISRIC